MRTTKSELSMRLTKDLSVVLLAARRQRGLSQRELAVKLGCPRTYISKLESQCCLISIYTLRRLAFVFGTRAWAILRCAEQRHILSSEDPGRWDAAPTDEAVKRAIGQTVLSARGTRKLTQAQLGKQLGVLPAYISRIERGHNGATLGTLSRLAHALKTPAWNLLRCIELRLEQPAKPPATSAVETQPQKLNPAA